MMYLHWGNGLEKVPPYKSTDMPLFLTDDFEVLEAPTYWTAAVSLRRSRSKETLKQYTHILARYLQWLDNEGYSAKNWQNVDENIIHAYVTHLIDNRDEYGRPSSLTIDGYISRLADFYEWAHKNGFPHYWHFIRETVQKWLPDQRFLDEPVEIRKLVIKTQAGVSTHHKREIDKFVRKDDFIQACSLLDDFVYKVMALTLWMTALRPKGLLQLPFLGTGLNKDLRRYHDHELGSLSDILFDFESKGKRRSIRFPALLWRFICEQWMPLRQERALTYKEKHGTGPPNNVLFLSKRGDIVTKRMLGYHFKEEVEKNPEYRGKQFTPRMLRHSFATYFVYAALKHRNMLGAPHVYDAVIDNELREYMGHTDIGTTYKFYVHLVNRFHGDDLIAEFTSEEQKEMLTSFPLA